MKVLLINAVCGTGSTGRICAELARDYERSGHTVKIAYGRDGFVPEDCRRFAVRVGADLDVRLHGALTRLTDRHGFGSTAATRRFLRWAEEFDPDVLWLHNLHGYYINSELLFRWIKTRPQMQVKWTLHDCWAMTGHCAFFSFVRCDRWKTGCHDCPQKSAYPASFLLDGSRRNYEDKRRLFTGIPNLTLITPSHWLARLVKQSFLREYPVEVCYHSIDRKIFHLVESDFRRRHGLAGKIILLGVASTWEPRKGLADFKMLAKRLDDRFRIVLVGQHPEQMQDLPQNILGLPRTNSLAELAEAYSAADLFLNPSYEETFGMTTLEAMACGTKAIVYRDTACEEIAEAFGGTAVPQGPEHLYDAVMAEFGKAEENYAERKNS